MLIADVSGAKELVEDQMAGAIIPRDPVQIARNIAEYYSSPTKLLSASLAARRKVEQNFNWDKIADRTMHLYQTIQSRR